MNRTNLWAGAPVVAIALALGGCAVTPSALAPAVKDAIADPDAFVIAFDTLRSSTLAHLPPGEAPVTFRRLEVNLRVAELDTSNIAALMKSRPTLTVRKVFTPGTAPGTVRSYDIWSTNDIPFRYNYRVTYRNLVSLKWQYVYVNRVNAEPYSEIKTLDRIDPFVQMSTEPVRAAYTFGTGEQISGFRAERMACTFGSVKPAQDLHPDLVGDFTDLACNFYGPNGQLESQAKLAYLQRYGIALATEHHNASSKTTYRIDSVRIEGAPGVPSQSQSPA